MVASPITEKKKKKIEFQVWKEVCKKKHWMNFE